MATFHQGGQVVGTQYNAEHITVYGQVTPRPAADATRAATSSPPVDVVLITPLEEERDAVLAQLDGVRQLPPTADDIRVYYAAELPVTFPDGTTTTCRVVVMPLLNMGRVEAANATGDAIRRWRPRYVWLVGIAGGLAKAGVALGDVLIADQVADYELQKLTPEGPSVRWQVHRVDPRLLGAARNLRGDGWLRHITCPRPEPGPPRRHIGAICTGDKVIANGLLDGYRDVCAKLVGVEMEAGGAASAAFQAAHHTGFFMVRGVSDLANADKDSAAVDRWRAYACEVAAAYAVGLLRSGPLPVAGAEGADRSRIYAHAAPRGGPDSPKLAFLRAVASAIHLAHVTELAADQVNEVAALLQLPLQEVPLLVTRLQEEGLVRLHWGGRVALTSEGRAQAEGTAPSGTPGAVRIGDVGAGAQVVIGSPGAVVGPGAVGAGAIRVDLGLGDLAAALQALQRAREGLSPEAQATAQELAGEVADIVHETQQPQPDKPGLAARLDQATSLMTRLGNVAEATQKLGPTLTLLGTALESLRRWVLGG